MKKRRFILIVFIPLILVSCKNPDLNLEKTDLAPATPKEDILTLIKAKYDLDNNADLNSIDVANVEDMSYLFKSFPNFNGNISKWNTSRVKNMEGMFYGVAVFNGDISNWDTSNVRNMKRMFKKAAKFNQDISKWNTSNVKTMRGMFYGAQDFNKNLSNWNVSKVEDTVFMFYKASNFAITPNANWNNNSITDASYMFGSTSITDTTTINWYTAINNLCSTIGTPNGVAELKNSIDSGTLPACIDLTLLTTLAGDSTNTQSNFTNRDKKRKEFNGDISNWDVSNVTNMNFALAGLTSFNVDISNWDVSNVKSMKSMFKNASAFNQDISIWNVSKVTAMDSMFENATKFFQNLSAWRDMFSYTPSHATMFVGTNMMHKTEWFPY